MAEKLVIQIDLETSNNGFKKVENQAKSTGKKAGRNFAVQFESGFKSIFKGALFANLASAAVIKGLDAVRDGLRGIFDAGIELEKLEVQFSTLLGSSTKATAQIKELQDFAASTPFQLQGIAESTQKLLAFGIAQEDIIEKLKEIGNVAAGSGSDLGELARIYGQVRAATKLTGERLLQFEERAVPIGPAIAKTMNVAESSVRSLVSEGKVSFEIFERAFASLSEEGEIFSGGMIKLSQTVGGLLSTLSDNFFNLSANISKTFAPIIKLALRELILIVQRFNKSFLSIKDTVVPSLLAFSQAFITYVVAPFELGYNVVDAFFALVNVAVADTISVFAKLGGVIGQVFESLGLENSITQGLQKFAEDSKTYAEGASANFQKAKEEILDFGFSDRLSTATEEIGLAYEQINAQVSEGNSQVEENLNKTVQGVTQAAMKAAQAQQKLLKDANRVINQGLAKTFSGGIQTITNSLLKGANAIEDFGNFILGAFGDLAIQLGEFYVATGLANLALLSANPAAQIATGAALIAVGSILKSFFSGGLGGSGGGATSGAGADATNAGDSGFQESELADPDNRDDIEPNTQVQLIVQGDVLDSDETGTRLAKTLSESFGKQGIVLTDARLT